MLEDIALAKRLRIAATTLEGILTIDNKAASSKPKLGIFKGGDVL